MTTENNITVWLQRTYFSQLHVVQKMDKRKIKVLYIYIK